MARPTLYTPELGEEICRRLAERESLNAICKADGMPAESTVRSWALDPKHPIAAAYDAARKVGYLGMGDEIIDISDEAKDPKLRIDARKWVLAKMLPKVFGDKVTSEITGKDGGPIETRDMSDLEVARRIAFMLGRAVGRQDRKQDSDAAKPVDQPAE